MSNADSGAAMTAIPGFTHRACTRTSGEVYKVIQKIVSTFRNVTDFDGRSVAAAASWQTLLICYYMFFWEEPPGVCNSQSIGSESSSTVDC
jgi:hypothetical protein